MVMKMYCICGKVVQFSRVYGSQGVKRKECERDIHLYITFHKVMAALSAGMKTRNQSPQWIRGLGQEN